MRRTTTNPDEERYMEPFRAWLRSFECRSCVASIWRRAEVRALIYRGWLAHHRSFAVPDPAGLMAKHRGKLRLGLCRDRCSPLRHDEPCVWGWFDDRQATDYRCPICGGALHHVSGYTWDGGIIPLQCPAEVGREWHDPATGLVKRDSNAERRGKPRTVASSGTVGRPVMAPAQRRAPVACCQLSLTL